ncbi:GDSL-type esterase/lipase family protein [Streptomyces sp. NPDC059649]|uniref:GDSL-type esterase/lipase family protein n=1 Tax=Streptomyces sp. NPDC059649 TaxID=3346895 RepID=UPI0036BAB97F
MRTADAGATVPRPRRGVASAPAFKGPDSSGSGPLLSWPFAQSTWNAVCPATTADTLDHQIKGMRDFAPDLLHIPCGANDLLRRSPDFREIERHMRKMYDLAAETGAQLTTFTLGRSYVVPVFPDWTERVLTLNDLTRALAGEYDVAVVDRWDHPVNSRENVLSADRLHFSTSGQAVMATEMVRALAALLARRTP